MKRAANEMERSPVKQQPVITQTVEKQYVDKQEKEQAKMTRQANGAGVSLSAATVSAQKTNGQTKKETGYAGSNGAEHQPPNPMQVVRLLHDLGDRLRRSEAEREALWRELERTQKFLGDIQDHSSKAEKAFLSLETQISRREKLTQDMLERQAKIEATQQEQASLIAATKDISAQVAKRIDNIETTAGSALVRIEDALNESHKLSKRLEQVSHDKARLLRKIETMEETLTLTQDTLKAKALVLLTDQVIASRAPLPQREALTEAESARIHSTVQQAAQRTEASPLSWPSTLNAGVDSTAHAGPHASAGMGVGAVKSFWKKSWTTTALVMVPVALLALVAGWGVSHWSQNTARNANTAAYDAEVQSGVAASTEGNAARQLEAQKASAATGANSMVDDVDALVKQAETDPSVLNDLEPGALIEGADSVQADLLTDPALIEEFTKAKAEEEKAVAAFNASRDAAPVADRIKSDRGLPSVVKDVEQKALAGDPNAQHDLAAIYTAGHANVKANYNRAATWFREAAWNGVANAQYNLGVLNHQGLGVKQNTAEAIMLYRVAAAQNHPEAQYNLGIAHIEGVGAEYNPQRAASYFEQAARGGIVEAAYNLGLVQENALLGDARPEEALYWYHLAAEEGNAQAREALTQLTKQMDLSAESLDKIIEKIASSKPGLAENMREARASAKEGARAKAGATTSEKVEKVNTNKTAVAKETSKPEAQKFVAKPAKQASLYDPVIVSQIQEQLVQMGFYPGPADGESNQLTEDAVRAYQSVNKLKIDGRPTEDVLVHMLAQEMNLNAVQKPSATPAIKNEEPSSSVND